MRWPIKKKETKIGTKKKKTWFAFWPKKIGNHKVWLERYWVEYEYKEYKEIKSSPLVGFIDDEHITKRGWKFSKIGYY